MPGERPHFEPYHSRIPSEQKFFADVIGGYSFSSADVRQQFSVDSKEAGKLDFEDALNVELVTGETPYLIEALQLLLGDEVNVIEHIKTFAQHRRMFNSTRINGSSVDVLNAKEHEIARNSSNNINEFEVTDFATKKHLFTLIFLASLHVSGPKTQPYLQRFGITRTASKDSEGMISRSFLMHDRRVVSFAEKYSPRSKRIFELVENAMTRTDHGFLGHSLLDNYTRDFEGVAGKRNTQHEHFFNPFFDFIATKPYVVDIQEGSFTPTNYEMILYILMKQAWKKVEELHPERVQEIVKESKEFVSLIEEMTHAAQLAGEPPIIYEEIEKYFISMFSKYYYLSFDADSPIFTEINEKYPWALKKNTKIHRAIHKHNGVEKFYTEIPATQFLKRFMLLVKQYHQLDPYQLENQYENKPLRRSGRTSYQKIPVLKKMSESIREERWSVLLRYGKANEHHDENRQPLFAKDDERFLTGIRINKELDPWTYQQVLFIASGLSKRMGFEFSTNDDEGDLAKACGVIGMYWFHHHELLAKKGSELAESITTLSDGSMNYFTYNEDVFTREITRDEQASAVHYVHTVTETLTYF
jgi:hypothetical protein